MTDSCKLFIGQLPKSYTEDQLKPLLEEFGQIIEVSIIRDKATGASRGCAFCTFATRESAQNAIATLHNARTIPPLQHPMQVKLASSEEEKRDVKLFIGMLPRTMTAEQLRPLFEPFGQIEELQLLYGPDGVGKGCGFLRYTTRDAAQRAIEGMNGLHKFDGVGNSLCVKWADNEKQKAAKRTQIQMQQAGAMMGMGGGIFNPWGQNQFAMAAALANQGGVTPFGRGAGAAGMPAFGGGVGAMGGMGLGMGGMAGMAGMGGMGGMASMGGMGGMQAAQAAQLGTAFPGAYGAFGAQAAAAVAAAGAGLPKQAEGPAGANLFIYHLPQEYGDADLAALFAPFGTVLSAKVFIDRQTMTSKCFGFVSYTDAASATAAISQMGGFALGSRRLKVSLKRSGQQPPY